MQLTPEATVGMIIVFGIVVLAILMMLKKLGIIKFTNSILNGNNVYHCPDHIAFCKSFKQVRDEHIICGQTVENHGKQLREGKVIFNDIKKDISEIKTNIALIKQKLEIS